MVKKLNTNGRLTSCRFCNFKFKILQEEKQNWYNLKNPCPNCGSLFCNLTTIEKELVDIQSEYLNSKNEIHLSKMYDKLLIYSNSLILKHFGKKLPNLSESLDYYCHKASLKVVEQYIKVREDNLPFEIKSSFGGYVIWKIKEAIYEKTEFPLLHDSIDDLSYINENYENNKMNSFDLSVECGKLEEIKKDILQEDSESDISNWFNQFNGELKVLIAILNFLKSGENKSNLVFQNFGNDGKGRFLFLIKQFKMKLASGDF